MVGVAARGKKQTTRVPAPERLEHGLHLVCELVWRPDDVARVEHLKEVHHDATEGSTRWREEACRRHLAHVARRREELGELLHGVIHELSRRHIARVRKGGADEPHAKVSFRVHALSPLQKDDMGCREGVVGISARGTQGLTCLGPAFVSYPGRLWSRQRAPTRPCSASMFPAPRSSRRGSGSGRRSTAARE